MIFKWENQFRWLLLPAVATLIAACVGAGQPGPSVQQASPLTSLVAVQAPPEGSTSTQGIQLIGVAEAVTDEMLTVNGVTVARGRAVADGPVTEGATVQIQATQTHSGVVEAEYIWVLRSAEVPTVTTNAETIPFVIEGPVAAISANRVRIHGFDLELDDDRRHQGVQVGDLLRIYGEVHRDYLGNTLPFDDDIDDDNYITVGQTRLSFLSNEVYVSAEGLVWRDSGSCFDAPPGWASASAWRSRCSGEYGGGPLVIGAGNEASGSLSSTARSNQSGTLLDRFFLFVPVITRGSQPGQGQAAGGDGSSSSIGVSSSGASGNESSGSTSRPPLPPRPPALTPPAGGDGSSSSNTASRPGASGNESSGSSSRSAPPPPPPPPPPPAGGSGASSSGSDSGSNSGSGSGSGS